MHATSFAMMEAFRPHIPEGARVLDVGGADVNGTYKPLFADCDYGSLDFDGSDIVVDGYDWPIEHDPWFWVTMRNMARVLRRGGVVVLIVPSAGGVHRHPVDCYRFLPDAMKALADWAGLELLGKRWDHDSKWHDLGAVFRKPAREME